MCGTLEKNKTNVNWYTKEYFLLRFVEVDFGLIKIINGLKTNEYQNK